MATQIIYVDEATRKIINGVTGARVSDTDLPSFTYNGDESLIIRLRRVTNAGTASATLTPITLGTGSAYQLSLTQLNDWDDTTAPLTRVNNPNNIYVSDAENSELTANWKNSSQQWRTYIGESATSGTAFGGIEMIELTADPAPLSDSIQNAGGIASGATQLTVADASDMKSGSRCLINDAHPEMVIITGVDFGSNTITFVGNSNEGGTVYSHANGVSLTISDSEEKVLLQDKDNLLNRRDLGGQEPTENDPAYYTAAETLALIEGRSKSYTLTFTQADVDSETKLLSVNHALNDQYALHVTIASATTGTRINPDNINYTDADNLTIDFTEDYADMSGNYHLRITK